MSRAGLEPATTALKDQNGLIASVPSCDFSVHYGNSISADCPSVRFVGHGLGHNRLRRTISCRWFPTLRRSKGSLPWRNPSFRLSSQRRSIRPTIFQLHPRTMLIPLFFSAAKRISRCLFQMQIGRRLRSRRQVAKDREVGNGLFRRYPDLGERRVSITIRRILGTTSCLG